MSTRGRSRPRDRAPAKTAPAKTAPAKRWPGAPPVSDAFGAIAHPLRREIVVALAAGEMAVRDLAERLPVTRPAVSQHLRVMLDVGLVTQQRVGRENRYRLHPQRLDEIRNWLTALDSSWAVAMKRLGEHLERTP